MARYFNFFPKLLYSIEDYTKITTNIMTRIREVDTYKNNTLVYYDYTIQEGDTPESIADKYYNDAEKHWVILLTNNIVDPIYDWPLNYTQFNQFLAAKYYDAAKKNMFIDTVYTLSQIISDPNLNYIMFQIIAYTQDIHSIHHYEKIVTSKDLVTGTTTTNTYIIDKTAYDTFIPSNYTTDICTVSESVQAVTFYDYEYMLNESKRNIKLLNNTYLNQIYTELQNLLKV